jgi:hypothetical protein
MFKERIGASEIQASLILLVIVSSGGAILYGITVDTLNSYDETITYNRGMEAQRILERFCVASIWWDASSDNLTLTVYNFGEYDLKIVDVYIDGHRTEIFYNGYNSTIDSGQLKEVVLQAPLKIVSNNEYAFTVVSERGVLYDYLWYS